jgi:hypothetical protein
MKHYREKPRDLPVLAETGVLVVGSGPAGLAAAIAAAREGAQVILLERYGFFGGNITGAMVESIAWYRHEATVEGGGIGNEFEARTGAMGGAYHDPESTGRLIDADIFKCVADEMISEAGVVPLLHCLGAEPIVEEGRIRGVITESKSGRRVILARRVIDATGDADLAARAGAPYHQADKADLMTVSTGFGVSGVDTEAFRAHIASNPGRIGDWASETAGKEEELFSAYFRDEFDRARREGLLPPDSTLEGYYHAITEAGEVDGMNLVRIGGVDPTDVWDLTRAEIEGRRQVLQALEVLRRYTPGFEKAKLRTFGPSVGVRESRKIVGRYELTAQDVSEQGRFDETVGIFPEFLDAFGIVRIPTTGRYFQVPYGIMVPRGIDNLLVAGRSVAGDRISHSATRQMMCCTVTGEAAGTAAAVSLNRGSTTADVEVTAVQRALEQRGVRIR